jgi:NTP pyrophosphatase (non-canonical NTP hydrolase)
MDLAELIQRQKMFDEAHAGRFEWSQRASPDDTQPLVYLALALAGEVGEIANVVKKLERGDLTYAEALDSLKEEAADVLIYLLKLSYQTEIDLEGAFVEKLRVNKLRFATMEKGLARSLRSSRPGPLLGLKELPAPRLRSDLEALAANCLEPVGLARLRDLVQAASVPAPADDRSIMLAGLAALALADIGSGMSPYVRNEHVRKLQAVCSDLGVAFELVQRLATAQDSLQDIFHEVPQP